MKTETDANVESIFVFQSVVIIVCTQSDMPTG
jgi:hypothetical protein